MVIDHVHISRGNSKLGCIPSVNMPPLITCRADAPCLSKCYARRGRFRFANVKSKAEQNLNVWLADPKFFELEIKIEAFHNRFFRWHSSGDIPDKEYLHMMVRVARELPNTRFLCFTKKYELVNDYFSSLNDVFPENLIIVFSSWGDYHFENPNRLPVAYIRFKDQSENSIIPTDAKVCQGFCGECVMTNKSCWSLKHNQSVVFTEH